ncbi:MAG: hypothetical protein ACRC62_31385 [Microcoleus sp.]
MGGIPIETPYRGGFFHNNIGSLNPVMSAGMSRSLTTSEAQRFPFMKIHHAA